MRKLTLNLDELRVEEFATIAPRGADEGSVMGIATLICSEKRSCGHVCP